MLNKLTGACRSFISSKSNWLSFIAGLFLFLGYAPFQWWWLPFIFITAWCIILDNKATLNKGQSAYAFALGWFTSGISWVHVSIADFGGLPLIISLLLMFFLCLYLALFPAFAIWLSIKASKILLKNTSFSLWLIAPFWLIGEYLRGVVLTGFPWLSFGYSQISSPLNSLAPIIGEVGLSFIILVICISLTRLYQQKEIKRSAILLTLCGLAITSASLITWVTPTDKTIKTALVQGNIAQELKWLPEKEWPTLKLYLELTEQSHDIDIFVWPESAIPAIEPSVQDYLALVNDTLHSKNSALITGIINYNFEAKSFYNTLIVLGNKENEQIKGDYLYGHKNRYNKYHLLPIGEFVPFEEILRPIAPFFNLPQSSFSRGDYKQDNLIANNIHILPLICFEIAFSEQLAANFTAQTQLLLTVSNDAWFADSHGPDQHMEIARMRALEFGRPLVRSTNTGITAAVDHNGKFINKLPQFEQGVLVSEIQLVEGNTPYSIYGRTIAYWLAVLFTAIIVLLNRKPQ